MHGWPNTIGQQVWLLHKTRTRWVGNPEWGCTKIRIFASNSSLPPCHMTMNQGGCYKALTTSQIIIIVGIQCTYLVVWPVNTSLLVVWGACSNRVQYFIYLWSFMVQLEVSTKIVTSVVFLYFKTNRLRLPISWLSLFLDISFKLQWLLPYFTIEISMHTIYRL